jgi:hypothetical protein
MNVESKSMTESISHFYQHTVLGKVMDIKEKLDPISVIAVVALLKFKESLTRIGFKGYHIITEQPSEYDYGKNIQGMVRWFFLEGREDLDIIPIAIDKGADWFHPEMEANAVYRELFTSALEGLSSLQHTYSLKKSGVTVSAITDWQLLIKRRTQISDEERAPDPDLVATALRVKNLWTIAEVKEVNSLIEQMRELQGDTPISDKVKCLDQIERLEFLLRQKGERLKLIYEGV